MNISKKKAKRDNYTLDEWTQRHRELERGYDAKRRAKKREETTTTVIDERRSIREAARKKANPPPSQYAFDTVVMAVQALMSCEASSAVEMEELLKQRIAVSKAAIQQ